MRTLIPTNTLEGAVAHPPKKKDRSCKAQKSFTTSVFCFKLIVVNRKTQKQEQQKQMLEDFARRNGLPNPTHFTDDGISGTRFARPGFLAIMEEPVRRTYRL